MERYTKHDNNGNITVNYDAEENKDGKLFVIGEKAIRKFCEYEDAEEEGRMITIPCKEGKTVYAIERECRLDECDSPTTECKYCHQYRDSLVELKYLGTNDRKCKIEDYGKTWSEDYDAVKSAYEERTGKGHGSDVHYKVIAKCTAPSDYMECGLICKYCSYNRWEIAELDGRQAFDPDEKDPRVFVTKKAAEEKVKLLEKEYEEAQKNRKNND